MIMVAGSEIRGRTFIHPPSGTTVEVVDVRCGSRGEPVTVLLRFKTNHNGTRSILEWMDYESFADSYVKSVRKRKARPKRRGPGHSGIGN
jgi:hypothetical protein